MPRKFIPLPPAATQAPARNMTEPQTGAELEALSALHAAREVAHAMDLERDTALDRVSELEGLLLLEREAHGATRGLLQQHAARFGFSCPSR